MVHLTHQTKPIKGNQIQRDWYFVDASQQIVGRLSTRTAELLIGKKKTHFVPHLDNGDYVVIVNANNVQISGKKTSDKIYTTYSGYPGGLKQKSYKEVKERKPTEILRHSISGMLPKNKMRKRRIKRLFIYADDRHPFSNVTFANK